MDDANLGPAMGQYIIEKKADEAKAAATDLAKRMANLETAFIQLQAVVIRLNDEIMRLRQ